jgi:hypothetical protein
MLAAGARKSVFFELLASGLGIVHPSADVY